MMKNLRQADLMAMNVTWSDEDLEFYVNRFGVVEATIFTIANTVMLAMGVIAQKTFYKMMKRLPGRAINQILYPHMVRDRYNHTANIYDRITMELQSIIVPLLYFAVMFLYI